MCVFAAGLKEGGRWEGYLHIIKVGKGSVMKRECVCIRRRSGVDGLGSNMCGREQNQGKRIGEFL